MSIALEAEVAAISDLDAVPALLEVVCRTTGMGFAAIARVTEDRWVACAVRDEIDFGLRPGGELQLETTICNEIRQSGQAVIIDEVSEDGAYCQHHTPAMYGFQSYISMPIFYPDGSFFGTLCAIDPKPAKLNRPEIVKMFRLFADLIMFYLQASNKLTVAETTLNSERETAVQRERFIAVLGHDLRNPLGAINAGTEVLKMESLSSRGMATLRLIQRSVIRMATLVENVLDVARLHMGAEFPLVRNDKLHKEDLEQVIAELQSAWPDREIRTEFVIAGEVRCDRSRISQLFSNLIGNALTHGAEQSPVDVKACCRDDMFEFSVSNRGNAIPSTVLATIFKPFSRHSDASEQGGLGLGLYIASEVARAHGGTLDVSSSAEETRFSFRMPMQ